MVTIVSIDMVNLGLLSIMGNKKGVTKYTFIILRVSAQAGFYVFAHMNEFKTKAGW